MKVIFYHLHPGVSRKLVKEYIENSEFIDGTHRVCIKNSHKLQCRCIQLDITDKRVFWAYRGSRKYPSPLISQKDAEEIGIEMTDEITVVFTKKNDVFRILTC